MKRNEITVKGLIIEIHIFYYIVFLHNAIIYIYIYIYIYIFCVYKIFLKNV